MSRHVLVLAALSLLLLSTTHCQKSKPAEPEVDVSKLEELPKETAAHLKRIPNSDLLVTEPPVEKEPPKLIVKPEPKMTCDVPRYIVPNADSRSCPTYRASW